MRLLAIGRWRLHAPQRARAGRLAELAGLRSRPWIARGSREKRLMKYDRR